MNPKSLDKKNKPDIITQMFESMGIKVVDVTPKNTKTGLINNQPTNTGLSDKNKTNKAEWEERFDNTFFNVRDDVVPYIKFFIHQTLSSERQRLIDQVEKEVIGEIDDLEVKLNDGMNGTDYQEGWDDACLDWDLKVNHLVEYLNQKLSAIRKEDKCPV